MRIFCDMDGVLTDFNHAYIVTTGYNASEFEENKRLKYKMVQHNRTFWKEMPWKIDGKELWDELNKISKPTILSAPSNSYSGFCKQGKNFWIDKYLGKDVRRIFIHARAKCRFSAPGRVLIDDRIANINDWKSRGGIGILHTHSDSTLKKLSELT